MEVGIEFGPDEGITEVVTADRYFKPFFNRELNTPDFIECMIHKDTNYEILKSYSRRMVLHAPHYSNVRF